VRIEKVLLFPARRAGICLTGFTGLTRSFGPAGSRAKYCIRMKAGKTGFVKARSSDAKNFPWNRKILLAEGDSCLPGCLRQAGKEFWQSCSSCLNPWKRSWPLLEAFLIPPVIVVALNV
jgi:hypothetical protein